MSALGIAVDSFWRGEHRAKTSNVKPDPCGSALKNNR